ncbi:MAG: SAM-dependent methyltransferase, partial [Nitrospinota bacterium]
SSMVSFETFVRPALKKLQFVDLSEHLATHYFRVRQELEKRYDGIMQFCDKTYIDRMITGLNHWIEAGRKGYLTWGILHFKKL